MNAVVWSDYVCPWCYFGRDRTALLRSMGIEVTVLPYELHPETPVRGVAMSDRWRQRFLYVQAQVGRGDEPFVVPERAPNSRLALELAEAVRRLAPSAFATLDDALFRTHFEEGGDIGDPATLDRLVGAAGADLDVVHDAVQRGDAAAWVDQAREDALDAGVTGTPAWLVDGRLMIPGVQPRAMFERLVGKMRSDGGALPGG